MQRSHFIIDPRVIFLKSLRCRTKRVCTTAHHVLSRGHANCLWKNGSLVILRYCELSVTEFLFVFLYFAQLFALFYTRAYAFKSSFLSLLLLFYLLFCHLLLVGFTQATQRLKFIHVRLVYWTWLPYAVERGPIPDPSVWEHCMFYLCHRYCMSCVFLPFCLLGFHKDTTLSRVWANTQLFFCCCCFHLITI